MCNKQLMYNIAHNRDEDISQAARLIDWSRGTLYWSLSDWKRILESQEMFCRKIADEQLAAMIFEHFGPQK